VSDCRRISSQLVPTISFVCDAPERKQAYLTLRKFTLSLTSLQWRKYRDCKRVQNKTKSLNSASQNLQLRIRKKENHPHTKKSSESRKKNKDDYDKCIGLWHVRCQRKF